MLVDAGVNAFDDTFQGDFIEGIKDDLNALSDGHLADVDFINGNIHVEYAVIHDGKCWE